MSPEEVEEIIRRTVESMNPDVKPVDNLPRKELPLEDVELTGEKVNYRIAYSYGIISQLLYFTYSKS